MADADGFVLDLALADPNVVVFTSDPDVSYLEACGVPLGLGPVGRRSYREYHRIVGFCFHLLAFN
jgi:hypothetical protein